ncbi:MAG: MFS transporter [Pseudomonadales bacterium]
MKPRGRATHLPPDRYRWTILAYTLLIQAVSIGSIYYCFALFAVPWLDEFGRSRAEVMLAVTFMQIGTGLLSPLIGQAMDRFRMRNMVLLGIAMYVIGYTLLSQVTSFWQVYIVYALCFPLALGLTGNLAAQVLVTRWFTRDRGMALGISAMGTNLGGVVFPLLAAGAIGDGLWREAALTFAVVSLVLLLPATLIVLARRSPGESAGAVPQDATAVGAILRTRSFLVCAFGFLCLNLAFNAVQANLAALAGDLGFGDWAGGLIALTATTMVAGKLLFGILGDRLPHQVLYWIAGSTMMVGLVLLSGQPSGSAFVAGVAAVGLAGGGLLPIMALIIGARFALASFGRVMGLMMLTLAFGAAGPVVAGHLHDLTGSYHVAMLLFASLLVPAMVVMIWLPAPAPVLDAGAVGASDTVREGA